MKATLYLPNQPPIEVPDDGLSLPETGSRFARVPEQVPGILDCDPGLVDVLACGPHYVAYSIFDFKGDVNTTAMAAIAQVTGTTFEPDNEDTVLCGPILIVTA